MNRAVLWDFDGTLATRPGLWSSCVIEVLDERWAGHHVTREQISPSLRGRFPWHDWQNAHDGVTDPEAWWEPILALIAESMVRVGVPEDVAPAFAERFRELYVEPTRWVVYPDSAPALGLLAANGWRNVIVSNHVPELPALVGALGLSEHVASVLSSATHGFEKPHPGAFHLALEVCGASAESAWMVGDNAFADIAGAGELGIAGVLVRVPEPDAAFVSRMEANYGAASLPGWREHSQLRAKSALEAAELIISAQ